MVARRIEWFGQVNEIHLIDMAFEACMHRSIASDMLFGSFYLARSPAVRNHIFVYQALEAR